MISVEISTPLDPEFSPNYLDGKMRFVVEDGKLEIRCDKESGSTYVAALIPLEQARKAFQMIGVIE